ncbi:MULTISPECIES: acylphosphatase [Salinivibrio]|jgi:acylphosphatase|uniref:Acylphosphatase n=1 Tax=Salinivibrio proteolyticus TaxID=334715 RepID=A0ABY7LJM0_9GAMM|nr:MULTISPECIES: acylphosphatase [Salinivibrio]OOF09543.1 acylphosphatase [Salinivibrio sp. PR5]OOF13208.1 acylphosphatase [Salinivibrio sp. PR919]OOF16014.1 acylphosphatase [Salinivibrio sp. PR932]OOF22001.1 acylphosphatase [Salinivibrio sp. IB574]OOF30332.1 acylphosphatase [Salinivibrio proteolyticus]
MSQKCVKAYVTGHVQGVGFRYHTAHEALKLSLTGYAKNLPDGRVEVLACGREESVDALIAWLDQGPPTASVNHVKHEDTEWRSVDGFAIQ